MGTEASQASLPHTPLRDGVPKNPARLVRSPERKFVLFDSEDNLASVLIARWIDAIDLFVPVELFSPASPFANYPE